MAQHDFSRRSIQFYSLVVGLGESTLIVSSPATQPLSTHLEGMKGGNKENAEGSKKGKGGD